MSPCGAKVQEKFITLEGTSGCKRAFRASDIRLLSDEVPAEGTEKGETWVTLVDGTQFEAVGDVASILALIGE